MARPISAKAEEDLKEMNLLPLIHIITDLSKDTTNPKNSGTLHSIMLMICQPMIKYSSFSIHATTSWKYQRVKWSQLYFSNSVAILPFLHHLVTPIYSRDTEVAVALCVTVKYPYIKKVLCQQLQNPWACNVYQLWQNLASLQWQKQQSHLWAAAVGAQ